MNSLLTFGAMVTAAQGLPVDGDDLCADGRAQALSPVAKAVGEGLGIKHRKHSAEGIVAGNAAGQFQKAPQPLSAGLAEILEVHKTLGATEHRAQSDQENLTEQVFLGAVHSRIVNG